MTEISPAPGVRETTVGGVLRDAAERAAETIALVEGIPGRASRRRWSYADLLTDAERVARALLPRLTGAVSRRVLARGCRGGRGHASGPFGKNLLFLHAEHAARRAGRDGLGSRG